MVELQRAPRCGHAWVVDIDPTLHDGLRELLPVRVRDVWAGECVICGERTMAHAGQYGEVLARDE